MLAWSLPVIHGSAAVLYVSLISTNPLTPYGNWNNAATNIQDAIDAATDGDQILVTNGLYQTGGRIEYGTMTNRVMVNKAVTLQSVNGPAVTWIQGHQVAGTVDGNSAVRCAYLTNGATLSGFTLTNGATRFAGDPVHEDSGGGAWCESVSAVLFNCVFAGNKASSSGGGAYNGWLINCVLVGNSAVTNGGGACNCVLINSLLSSNSAMSGGGADGGELDSCILTNNTASFGGGACSATLNSCTLTANSVPAGQGGGAYQCQLENCTLNANSAGDSGGGVYLGALDNCTLSGNFSSNSGGGEGDSTLSECTLTGNYTGQYGGAAYQGTLNSCALNGNSAWNGGGAFNSILSDCTLSSNSATFSQGGGVYRGTLNNCLLIGNSSDEGSAAAAAGAVYGSICTLNNCTLVGNSASGPGAASATENVILNNCIVYFNSAPTNPNFDAGSTLNYCCTMPSPAGLGNITNEPAFVNPTEGDFHLQSNSPCINAGANEYATSTNDFDGNPRIVGGTVDLGAYEYQTPTSIISYAWLQQYDLAIDGSADYLDLDGTGMNNWQKWTAGLNPTNPASLLVMLPPVASSNPNGVTIIWQSVNDRTYYLQRCSVLNASPCFSSIQSNLVGQAGTTSFTDTSATNGNIYFYRVGIQR
jgi:hypothetical protein